MIRLSNDYSSNIGPFRNMEFGIGFALRHWCLAAVQLDISGICSAFGANVPRKRTFSSIERDGCYESERNFQLTFEKARALLRGASISEHALLAGGVHVRNLFGYTPRVHHGTRCIHASHLRSNKENTFFSKRRLQQAKPTQ